MPFVAEHDSDGDSERITPAVASRDMDLTCPKCGDPLTVVRRHPRAGSFVPRHFRHLGDRESGGGGGCTGESDTPMKMKSIVADRLRFDLGDVSRSPSCTSIADTSKGGFPTYWLSSSRPSHLTVPGSPSSASIGTRTRTARRPNKRI